MKDKSFSKTKFNIAWVSVTTIFIGTVIYVPLLKFSQEKKEVVYYQVPVETPQTFGLPENTNGAASFEEKKIVIEKHKDIITKDLKLGDEDPEVKLLQQYLNGRGFLVAESGPGSLGQETIRFGAGTEDALIRFQEANADIILKPFGLKQGTGVAGEMTRKLINS